MIISPQTWNDLRQFARLKRRIRLFLFPRPWSGCHEPQQLERLAAWEIRLGQWLAEQRMRQAAELQMDNGHTWDLP